MTTPTKATATVKADTAQAVTDLERFAAATFLNQPKSGFKTSEFLGILIGFGDDYLMARYGHDWGLKGDEPFLIALGGNALSGVYAWARTWLKGKHVVAAKGAS